jgi:hypothetical protein
VPAIAFLPAIFADAVNLKRMSRGHVVMLSPYRLFKLAYFGRKKLYGSSALGAHHVMVAAAIVLVLVSRNAVMKRDFACQSAVGEQLQSAVDGRESDMRVFLFDQLGEFVSREMFASFKECPENRAALLRLLESHTPQMAQENSLGLAHIFRRDTQLIVNSLLQHSECERN